MSKYILALEQGMSASRAIVFDDEGSVLASAKRDLGQLYPQQGWAEQEPMELWSSQYAVMMEVVAKSGIAPGDIAAVGITAQRETTVLWEKATGRPICNAISWQCRRTAPIVQGLLDKGLEGHIRKVTGLVPDACFSGPKIQWILDNVPGAREKARRGEVLFGTVDSWLLWKLTQGRVHATDYTNAGCTMLFDIDRLQWDDTLLDAMDIPRAMLPEVYPSSHLYGTTSIGGCEVPIASLAGDQQAALFGQCCFEKGQAKNTYGSGSFLLMNTGKDRVKSPSGLVTGLACGTDDRPDYVLEGSVFVGAGVLEWLRDRMRFIEESADAAYYAQKVEDNGGIYLVPAFTGLGAPYWDMYARGCLVGITRGTRREHIIRAALESIAYQSADLVRTMEKDAGVCMAELKVDGGAIRERFLMQFQADVLDKKIRCSELRDTTALGAAYLAGLAVGLWHNTRELADLWTGAAVYRPSMNAAVRDRLLRGWHKAVGRSLHWEEAE